MRRNILLFFLSLISILTARAGDVNVTLTTYEYESRPAHVDVAAQNLAKLLTEINRAQAANRSVNTSGIAIDELGKQTIDDIWKTSPFYVDDEEIVERCWVFSNGELMVSHIPLIITPQGEDFGNGSYQEAGVEFDKRGRISDFRFALSEQMSESMERAGTIATKEQQMIILKNVEYFRTAYNRKDIDYIERMFSDDAPIITGRVVKKATNLDGRITQKSRVEYTKQSKEQYIANLKKAFLRNKWIDVQFEPIQIGDTPEDVVSRSQKDPTKFGIRLRQTWRSSGYSDEGYLFLLWEIPENGGDPIIHVRTWQPDIVDGIRVEPDPETTTLAGFGIP